MNIKWMYLYLVKTCKIYMSYLLLFGCVSNQLMSDHIVYMNISPCNKTTLLAENLQETLKLRSFRDAERFAISSSRKVAYQKNSKIEKQHPP